MKTSFVAAAIAACLPAVSLASQVHLEYPLETQVIKAADDALRLVQSRYDDTDSMVLTGTVSSLLGTHYHFAQANSKGEPCKGALVVSTGRDGQLYRVFNTLVANPGACDANLPLAPRPHTLVEPPEGEAVTASLMVFDPDPRTATGRALEDGQSNVDNIVVPAEAYRTVDDIEVTRAGGKLYLANSRVTAVDITHMFGEAVSPRQGIVSVDEGMPFAFRREQAAFRDVNAFYHLDHSLRYLEALGFVGGRALFTAPLKIDAQGEAGNNSTYLSDIDVLSMGTGGVPDSEDADVVLHEFAHAITERLTPDWQGGDTEAMGEGFSDYWAGAYSYWVQRDRAVKFEPDLFGNWDGITGALKSRRSLNDADARYYPEFDYRAHVSVMGTLSDELWSTPLFQTLKQAVEVYGEGAFDEFNRIVLEGQAGIGYGAKMHDVARSTVDAAARLYPDKDYAVLLEARFKNHQILRDDVMLAQSSNLLRSPDGKRVVLPAALVNTSGRQLVGYRSDLSLPALGWSRTVRHEGVADGHSHSLGEALTLPVTLQCGDELVLTAETAASHSSALQPFTSRQQVNFIYGDPQLAIAPQVLDQALADARPAPLGDKIVLGDNLYALKVDDGAGVVGNDFAIYLSLSHERLSDLKVTVRAPSGRSITLVGNQALPLASHEYLYTIANTPALEQWAGEPLAGNWTLDITDRVAGNVGEIHRWGIGPVTGYQCAAAGGDGDKGTVAPAAGASGGSLGLTGLLASLFLAGVRRRIKR